ncbi:MAG TPA: gluconate 2-dehydrogenase subunit 3 family protein [Ktedonobacteraceae bacterium]|nr:gluconate 2-dehydrogenase subunit 3 family protein [Ktedonobacteraceae bacterium]
MSKTTRREFLKIGLAAAGGALAASGLEIPLFGGNTSSLQNQIANLNKHISTVTGFLILSIPEQQLLEPIVETIIPSDSTGPGAKEAGVIYFIDRQLASDYGQSGNMFMDAPHNPPGIPASAGPLKVKPSSAWAFLQNYQQTAYLPAGGGGGAGVANPISYPGASRTYAAGGTNYTVNYGVTASPRVGSGINYQYPLNMREFWRVSLAALQAYSNKYYSGNYQSLSSANQLQLLKDLWSNAPKTKTNPSPPADDLTGFSNIQASDFAYELTFMTWAGFLMDPIYGGNKDMVGWDYVGFNGVNFGDFYGEGLSQKTLMVASSPTKLKPASLAQYQQQATGGT